MADREKVIRGLEQCTDTTGHRVDCYGCYQEGPGFGFACRESLMRDALALLREQETEYKPDGPDFIDGRMFTRWKCTSCQYFVCTEKGPPDMKYCPNCGRRVVGCLTARR